MVATKESHSITILTLLFSSSCPTTLSAQRSELGSLSSSASDPLRHHSHQQPYDIPSHEATDDLNNDDGGGNNDVAVIMQDR